MSVQDIYNARQKSLGYQPVAQGYSTAIAVRKSFATLTQQEKDDYVRGVKLLKASGIYDQFVAMHVTAMKDYSKPPANYPRLTAAHNGPGFLPWHRRFLYEFELNLASVLGKPNYGLPYWDWSAEVGTDNSLATSQVWNKTFMGGSGTPIAAGMSLFSKNDSKNNPQWLTVSPLNGNALTRTFGSDSSSVLVTKAQVTRAVNDTDKYEDFRLFLENAHDPFHNWVGGQMASAYSPDDPTFFLHHCFFDRLWAQWQWNHHFYSGINYPADPGLPNGHNLNKPLYIDENTPWNGQANIPGMHPISDLRPYLSDWLNHENLAYRYDDELNWFRYAQLSWQPISGAPFPVFVNADNTVGCAQLPRVTDASTEFLLRPGPVFTTADGITYILSSSKSRYIMISNRTDAFSQWNNPLLGVYLTMGDGRIDAKPFGNSKTSLNQISFLSRQTFEMALPNFANPDKNTLSLKSPDASRNYLKYSQNALYMSDDITPQNFSDTDFYIFAEDLFTAAEPVKTVVEDRKPDA